MGLLGKDYSLRAVMTELGVAPDRLKVAGAWAGEKAGRLKAVSEAVTAAQRA